MKVATYNVNGIRAAFRKEFLAWVKAATPDIVCLQETKARPEQIKDECAALEAIGYAHQYFESAEKKGYSGVAVLMKEKPDEVIFGMGNPKYDSEGRVLSVVKDGVLYMSVYMPSGSSGDERQAFKYEWLDDFFDYIAELKKKYPKLVISGDYNICHLDIDIHNPSKQHKTSGFLPEERAWVSKFIESGFVDSFRHFNKDPHHYSWWSYRARAREKNLGWRIDYHMVSEPLAEALRSCRILPEAKHSDHCPVMVELEV
jgi:exodeoxyribonuclease-3